MIQEDYVSFELAKLLKEKGFNAMCEHYFSEKLDGSISCHTAVGHWNAIMNFIARPSLSLAMKWLREVHNKHCDIGYDIDLGWFFQIIDLKETVEYDYLETKCYHTENEIGFNSYEEAVEAALKYCLTELI